MNRRQFLKGLIGAGIITICPVPIPIPKPIVIYHGNIAPVGAMTSYLQNEFIERLWSKELLKQYKSNTVYIAMCTGEEDA